MPRRPEHVALRRMESAEDRTRFPAPSRGELGHGLFRLWLVNVFVGCLIGSLWFFDAPPDRAPWIRAWSALGLVASVGLLALVPGALFTAIARWVPGTRRRWRLACGVAALVGATFLVVLYTDTIVYRLLRYHFFDSAVLNVALTEGSGDAIVLRAYVWITAVVVLGALTLAEFGCATLFTRRVQALRARGDRAHLLLRPRTVVLAGFVPLLAFSQSVGTAVDAAGHREARRAVRPLPIAPSVPMARVLDPLPESGSVPALDLLPDDARLDWPAVAPALPPGAPRHSVCIVVLDSWRRDMRDPDLTPRIAAFAQDGTRDFADHVSGGNGTRHGLFSMLYGLHGSYWFPVLEAGRSPVLIDALQDARYDVRVFSSASMSFPELRSTAWSRVPDAAILDTFEPGLVSWQKDEQVADAFEDWMALRRARSDARPFFAFVLLDAPHQPYDNPGGPYAPAVDALDYIELGRTTDGPELAALQLRVRNAYRNSVHHADGTTGRILDALEASSDPERTVTIVTGDHGEEFFECGFWGHTSSFSPEQVEVPFLLRGPGIEPGVEERPTSHLDVSCTLLERLGVDPALRSDYSLGESLLEPLPDRARVAAGWSEVGLITPSGIFVAPLTAPRFDGPTLALECFDRRWRPLPDVAQRCRGERIALAGLARDCARFLVVE
ncbi:MAG: sulfatase-like hydrolase/transferase [Planctomycetota bacterium]